MEKITALMAKEYAEKLSKIVWSETLTTLSGCRVALLNMNSYGEHQGYDYVAAIDYGNEVAVETYNENGEWNDGVSDHPLNIVVKAR